MIHYPSGGCIPLDQLTRQMRRHLEKVTERALRGVGEPSTDVVLPGTFALHRRRRMTSREVIRHAVPQPHLKEI